MVKDQQEAQAVTLVVVWFLEVVVVVTIEHRPHRQEALLIVIGQAIRPVPVSVQKLEIRPAGTSCPPGHSKAFCSAYNVAAGSSATTTKPGSSTQKGNTSAVWSGKIIPHHPTRRML